MGLFDFLKGPQNAAAQAVQQAASTTQQAAQSTANQAAAAQNAVKTASNLTSPATLNAAQTIIKTVAQNATPPAAPVQPVTPTPAAASVRPVTPPPAAAPVQPVTPTPAAAPVRPVTPTAAVRPVTPAPIPTPVKPAAAPPVQSAASAVVQPVAPTGELQVVIGTAPIKFTTGKPYAEGNNVMVPIRELAEHLGAKTEWNQTTKTATLSKDEDKVEIIIGSVAAKVNGKAVMTGINPVMRDDRIYMPIKFLGEALGAKYTYDSVSKIATIS